MFSVGWAPFIVSLAPRDRLVPSAFSADVLPSALYVHNAFLVCGNLHEERWELFIYLQNNFASKVFKGACFL